MSFVEKKESSTNTVFINNRNYEVCGDSLKIEWLKSKIPDLNNRSEFSLEDLKIKLQNLGAEDITASKTHSIGIERLSISQDNIPEKGAVMDRIMKSWEKERGFSGTVLVMDQGKPLLKNGYGSAKVKTKFPIGSVTKPITSFAILRLVKNGAFKDPKTGKILINPSEIKILDFLPESFQPKNQVREDWEKITLQDLMDHTSGLPSFPEMGKQLEHAKGQKKHPHLASKEVLNLLKSGEKVADITLSPKETLDLIRNTPIPFEKKGYNYSNFGYHLLGIILEKVSGKSYQECMNNFLEIGLGLNSTGYVNLESDENFAKISIWKSDEKKHQLPVEGELDSPIEGYSSGGLYSTVEDLQQLTAKMIEELPKNELGTVVHEPGNFRPDFICHEGWNISLGDWSDGNNPIKEIWKTGAIGGYSSLVVHYPNHRSSICILSNNLVLERGRDGKEMLTSDTERITTELAHALFNSSSLNWEGVYSIPEWGSTFSIIKQPSGYVLREAHPKMHEIPINISDKNQVSFLWGPKNPEGNQEIHFIKKTEKQLFLCGPEGQLMVPIKKLL